MISCSDREKSCHVLALQGSNFVRKKILTFTNSTEASYRLHLFLEKFTVRSDVLNAWWPEKLRQQILEDFNGGNLDYLIATDDEDNDKANAGLGGIRGIDFKNVHTVINFDLPLSSAGYVRRIGRTGRDNTTGAYVSLVTPKELETFKEIKSDLGEERMGKDTEFIVPNLCQNDLNSSRTQAESVAWSVTENAVRKAMDHHLTSKLLIPKPETHVLEYPENLDTICITIRESTGTFRGFIYRSYLIKDNTREFEFLRQQHSIRVDPDTAAGSDQPYVIVCGGIENLSQKISTQVYMLDDLKMESAMLAWRTHVYAFKHGSKLFTVGGIDGHVDTPSDISYYNLAPPNWQALCDMPWHVENIVDHSFSGNKLLLSCDTSKERMVYDIENNKFYPFSEGLGGGNLPKSFLVEDGVIYFVKNETIANSIWFFDISKPECVEKEVSGLSSLTRPLPGRDLRSELENSFEHRIISLGRGIIAVVVWARRIRDPEHGSLVRVHCSKFFMIKTIDDTTKETKIEGRVVKSSVHYVRGESLENCMPLDEFRTRIIREQEEVSNRIWLIEEDRKIIESLLILRATGIYDVKDGFQPEIFKLIETILDETLPSSYLKSNEIMDRINLLKTRTENFYDLLHSVQHQSLEYCDLFKRISKRVGVSAKKTYLPKGAIFWLYKELCDIFGIDV